jgi:hypothetical protein
LNSAPAELQHEPHGGLIARRYIESIFDGTEPGQVLAILNRFLTDFAASQSARQSPRQLCPDQIGSVAELDSWLIRVRIEAERREAEPSSGNPDLLLLKGMLDAASRQIKTFASR